MARFTLALLLTLPIVAQDKPEDRAEWTVLVYMAADNDLEGYAVDDVRRMMATGHSDRVNVVIQIDRSPKGADEKEEGRYSDEEIGKLGNFTGTKRAVVLKDEVRESADLGETNTGDPNVLEDFLAWGLRQFPAKRTALIFWDHGYGWPGFGADESHEDDRLTLAEMTSALTKGCKRGGVERLDFLGFDCCLMANLDVLNACRSGARIAAGSEEIVPQEGWNYTSWLGALAKNPATTPEGLGKSICASFQEYFEKNEDEGIREQASWTTLSVVDLDAVPSLIRAVDALASKLEKADWKRLAGARRASEEFGQEEEPEASDHLIDLHHFARNAKSLGADEECAAVIRAVEKAVICRVAGSDHPQHRGISVYFPEYAFVWDEEYSGVAGSKPWLQLLQAYLKHEAGDRTAPRISKCTVSAAEYGAGEEVDVSAKLIDDAAESRFVLLSTIEKTECVVGSFPAKVEDAVLRGVLGGVWPAIGDAKSRIVVPPGSFEPIEGRPSAFRCSVPAAYRAPEGKEWTKLTLRFEVSWTGSEIAGRFISAFGSTSFGPTAVRVKPGGTIRPLYLAVTEGGKLERRAFESSETLTVSADGIGVVKSELPTGVQRVGFLVVDDAGNASLSATDVHYRK